MADRLRIAVVGSGGRAQAHLSTIAKLHDVYALAAVCDVVPERAEAAAQKYGAAAYHDLAAMLAAQKPDVVLVTVPPEYHHQVARQAAAAGAHVISETPIAPTLAHIDAMAEACRRHGVKLELAENVWRFPQERLKKRLVDAGLIGRISTVRLWYSSGSYHGINAIRTLVGSPVVEVTGRAAVVAAPKAKRYVDPFHYYTFGPAGQAPPAYLSETEVAAWEAGLLKFANGVMATYELPIGRPRGNLWELQGTDGYLAGNEVFVHATGARYTIRVEQEEIDGAQVVTGAALYEGERRLSEFHWANPHVKYRPTDIDDVARMDEHLSLCRAIRSGGEPDYGAAGGRADMEVLIAVRESARLGGQTLKLPLQAATGYEANILRVHGPVEA